MITPEYKWIYDDLLVFKNQNDCMILMQVLLN